jgi:FlaA1/EpsC-like NDP-sugar epimerase
MTIPEAVLLVLQAAVLGKGGEVFMLDMGEPVKIVNLARDLIELSGLDVGRDIEISITGTRPGEKLFEELFIPGESYRRTEHQKIFVIESAADSVLPSQLNQTVAQLEDAAYSNNVADLAEGLRRLLPNFRSGDEVPQSDLMATDDAAQLPGLAAPAAQRPNVSAQQL